MLTLADIERNITAIWRVFRGEADGLRMLDASYDGFWRSFGVIVLLMPVYGVYVFAEYRTLVAADLLGENFDAGFYLLGRTISLVVDWLAFPLAMLALAIPLRISHGYALYITAYNWSSLLIAPAIAVPAIMFGLGLIPGILATLLAFIGLGVFARLRFLIARQALNASHAMAIGLVIFDFLLGLLIAEMIDRVLGL